MSLPSYTLFNPPIPLDFQDMSPQQARSYFEWFVGEIPFRISELERIVGYSCPEINLDYSLKSLKELGKWFDDHVALRNLTHQEIAQERANAPSWFHQYLAATTLTDETISLCFDLGIYFAEVLRSRNPVLRWDYVRKPKNHADLHQPVLKPFRNGHLNPFRIMVVVAGEVCQGKTASDELPEALRIWESLISNKT